MPEPGLSENMFPPKEAKVEHHVLKDFKDIDKLGKELSGNIGLIMQLVHFYEERGNEKGAIGVEKKFFGTLDASELSTLTREVRRLNGLIQLAAGSAMGDMSPEELKKFKEKYVTVKEVDGGEEQSEG